MTVLRKEKSIYLAVETGTPPIKRDLRAIPWGDVAEVDHAALTIRLRPSVDVDQALMLDPGKAVEDGPADATRAEPPEEVPGPFGPDESGPVDRTLPYAATFALADLRPVRTSSREWLQAFPPTVRKQLNLCPC